MASGVDLLGAAPLGAQGAGAGATTYKNAQASGSVSVGASFAIGKLSVGTIAASISVTASNTFGKNIIATPSAAATSVAVAAVVQRIIHATASPAAPALFYYCQNHSGMGAATTQLAASTTSYTVTVSYGKYYINGVQQAVISLTPGGTYTFDQSHSSNANHPLKFSTTSNGTHSGGSTYTNGITSTGTPGQAGAKTVVVVPTSASVTAPTVSAGAMQFPVVGAVNIAATAAQPEMQRRRFMSATASMAIISTGAAGRLERTTAAAAVAVAANASASVELLFSGSLLFSIQASAASRATFSPAIIASFSVLAPAVDGLRIFTILPNASSTAITATANAQRVRPVAANAALAVTAQAVAGLAPPIDIAPTANVAVTAQAAAGKLATTSAVAASLSVSATASARIIRIDLMSATATAVVSSSAVPRAIRLGSALSQMSMTKTALQTSRLAVTAANIAVTVSASALAGFFRDGVAATAVSCNVTATGRLLWEPVAADGADPWAAVAVSDADIWTPQSGGNVEAPADIWQTAA